MRVLGAGLAEPRGDHDEAADALCGALPGDVDHPSSRHRDERDLDLPLARRPPKGRPARPARPACSGSPGRRLLGRAEQVVQQASPDRVGSRDAPITATAVGSSSRRTAAAAARSSRSSCRSAASSVISVGNSTSTSPGTARMRTANPCDGRRRSCGGSRAAPAPRRSRCRWPAPPGRDGRSGSIRGRGPAGRRRC